MSGFETHPRVSRRGMMVGVTALAAASTARAQATGSQRLMFAVFRNASEIGRHSVSIQRSGDDATAAIDAAFTVKIGPVPVFRYHHEAVEVWRDGRFISLKSTSISNGAREQVSAMRTGSGVTIDCAKGRIVAGDAAPLTHWNSHALRRTLFNPQTGALLRDTVTGPDRSSVKLYDGRIAPVTRYILTGDAGITDFYDEDGAWAGLRGLGPDKSTIEYRRMG